MGRAIDEEDQVTKPQFSLRSLFIVTLLVAALCGFCKVVYDAVRPHIAAYTLVGPQSPTGMRVFVDVHDNTPGFSTCFLADVRVVDPCGALLETWVDPIGQGSPEGVKEMIASMQWTDECTLQFVASDWPRKMEIAISVKPSIVAVQRHRLGLSQ